MCSTSTPSWTYSDSGAALRAALQRCGSRTAPRRELTARAGEQQQRERRAEQRDRRLRVGPQVVGQQLAQGRLRRRDLIAAATRSCDATAGALGGAAPRWARGLARTGRDGRRPGGASCDSRPYGPRRRWRPASRRLPAVLRRSARGARRCRCAKGVQERGSVCRSQMCARARLRAPVGSPAASRRAPAPPRPADPPAVAAAVAVAVAAAEVAPARPRSAGQGARRLHRWPVGVVAPPGLHSAVAATAAAFTPAGGAVAARTDVDTGATQAREERSSAPASPVSASANGTSNAAVNATGSTRNDHRRRLVREPQPATRPVESHSPPAPRSANRRLTGRATATHPTPNGRAHYDLWHGCQASTAPPVPSNVKVCDLTPGGAIGRGSLPEDRRASHLKPRRSTTHARAYHVPTAHSLSGIGRREGEFTGRGHGRTVGPRRRLGVSGGRVRRETFGTTTGAEPTTFETFDLDGDGDLDVLAAAKNTDQIKLWRAQPAGTFTEVALPDPARLAWRIRLTSPATGARTSSTRAASRTPTRSRPAASSCRRASPRGRRAGDHCHPQSGGRRDRRLRRRRARGRDRRVAGQYAGSPTTTIPPAASRCSTARPTERSRSARR